MQLAIIFDFETEDILLGGVELQILELNKLEERELWTVLCKESRVGALKSSVFFSGRQVSADYRESLKRTVIWTKWTISRLYLSEKWKDIYFSVWVWSFCSKLLDTELTKSQESCRAGTTKYFGGFQSWLISCRQYIKSSFQEQLHYQTCLRRISWVWAFKEKILTKWNINSMKIDKLNYLKEGR